MPKIGLLPLYLKLYDDCMPDERAKFDDFLKRIAAGFEQRGVAVQTASVCRLAAEFESAVGKFESAGVDALVTVHLAYSPSLESLDTICGSTLPLIILDTTMDASFGVDISPSRIMYNHGVHGVMDFACMLRRRKRPYEIVAGALDATLFDRAADQVRAAVAARHFRGSKLLRIDSAFQGMGDFSVEEDVLSNKWGISVREVGLDALDKSIEAVEASAVEAELFADRERFECEADPENHAAAVKVGLGLRQLIEEEKAAGFSINFEGFTRSDRPANMMPFLEISKAMARGVGYAGEGDVLTAALVGALARAFGETTFTEIFCPDWKGGNLFLSHMGEISPTVADGKARLFTRPFFLKGALDTALLTCAVTPGPAVFVNLAPGPDDSFSLIIAPVEVQSEDEKLDPAMRNCV